MSNNSYVTETSVVSDLRMVYCPWCNEYQKVNIAWVRGYDKATYTMQCNTCGKMMPIGRTEKVSLRFTVPTARVAKIRGAEVYKTATGTCGYKIGIRIEQKEMPGWEGRYSGNTEDNHPNVWGFSAVRMVGGSWVTKQEWVPVGWKKDAIKEAEQVLRTWST